LSGLFDEIDRNLSRLGQRIAVIHELQTYGLLRASSLLLGLLGILLLLLLPKLVGWSLRRLGRLETNFRGQRIPQSFGLVTLLWSCTMFAGVGWLYVEQRSRAAAWLICCAGYGLLGLLDDIRGTHQVKGLRGHFRAALRDRVITTGFIKAVGGVLLAVWLAMQFVTGILAVLLAAGVIALSANMINLLDLRPGRAGAVFLVCALLTVASAGLRGQVGFPLLLLVIIPALRVWEADARALVMMGDAGSNLLGAALGLGIVTTVGSYGQIVVLALLALLHICAERRSLTAVIQQNRVLNFLDRLTGVR
jgi:UDP-N-acetylmuramyl pentapeptide phosphotransferase/UDP-N-acetylglucosamine-1-phosphate transferase